MTFLKQISIFLRCSNGMGAPHFETQKNGSRVMAVLVTAYLVGGFKDFQTFFIFHFIYGLILPIDYCNISSRWLNHQPGIDDMYIYI